MPYCSYEIVFSPQTPRSITKKLSSLENVKHIWYADEVATLLNFAVGNHRHALNNAPDADRMRKNVYVYGVVIGRHNVHG
jgi:hypothetical protein